MRVMRTYIIFGLIFDLIFGMDSTDNVRGEKFSDVGKFQIEPKKCTF